MYVCVWEGGGGSEGAGNYAADLVCLYLKYQKVQKYAP